MISDKIMNSRGFLLLLLVALVMDVQPDFQVCWSSQSAFAGGQPCLVDLVLPASKQTPHWASEQTIAKSQNQTKQHALSHTSKLRITVFRGGRKRLCMG